MKCTLFSYKHNICDCHLSFVCSCWFINRFEHCHDRTCTRALHNQSVTTWCVHIITSWHSKDCFIYVQHTELIHNSNLNIQSIRLSYQQFQFKAPQWATTMALLVFFLIDWLMTKSANLKSDVTYIFLCTVHSGEFVSTHCLLQVWLAYKTPKLHVRTNEHLLHCVSSRGWRCRLNLLLQYMSFYIMKSRKSSKWNARQISTLMQWLYDYPTLP